MNFSTPIAELIYFSSPRYSDDVFDRLWHGTLEGFILPSVPISTLSNIDTQGSNDSYKLPAQVLRTAIQPASGYSVLSYEMANRDNGEYFKCYICFHFAEVEEVKEGELREFVIDVNERDYISEPITLEYLKPKSVCPNRTFQGQFSFTINATAKSTLLPILNAFDIYELLSFPSLPTHPADGALSLLSFSLIIIITSRKPVRCIGKLLKIKSKLILIPFTFFVKYVFFF